MTKLKMLCLNLLVVLSFGTPLIRAQSLEPHWQEAKAINGNFKAVATQPDIEIFSAPHIIMLKVNHEIDIRLFTILGKLISASHLEPGIYEFRMEAHGIYIIKTNEISYKIAI